MRGTTHILFAILIGVIFLQEFPIFTLLGKYLFIVFLIIGATLPDFDQKSFWFDHRGVSHSIFLPAILAGLAWLFFAPIYGLAMGFFSHIISDSLTKQGWKPFTPFSKFRIRGFISTGGLAETLLAGLLALLIVIRIIS